jgi:hypothetical protein
MRTSRLALVGCLLALAAAGACGGAGSPARPDGAVVVEPIQIDSVSVSVAASSPVRVFARVTGVVGDGCATLLPIEQRRAGPQVTLEIKRQRPRDAVCTQIARLFDETIALDGEFPPGSYALQVNTVTRTFVVE